MRIYLDHNATTPVRDAVVEAMTCALREGWGNPSSVHAEGADARARVERARAAVATQLGVAPGDVVFTSGASEANNTALLRIAGGPAAPGRHVVSSNVEHPSVEAPLVALEANGWRHVSSTTSSSKGTTQVYEKQDSSLQIMIYEGWYYTWTEVSTTRIVGRPTAPSR